MSHDKDVNVPQRRGWMRSTKRNTGMDERISIFQE